jgi:hypothetical protein
MDGDTMGIAFVYSVGLGWKVKLTFSLNVTSVGESGDPL